MSPAKNHKLKIAAMCDLHFSELPPNLSQDVFEQLNGKADVLLLGGDITDQGSPKEAEIAAKAISVCKVPTLAVLGNHDFESGQENQVKEILQAAGVYFLEHHPFTLQNVSFVGTKGFGGGFGTHLLAPFGEPVIKKFVAEATEETFKLENQLKALTESSNKIVVLLHYAPVAETVKGEPPEIYPFLGCSRLAETIDRYRVSAVFHGHVHHGRLEGKTPNGVPVYNCCVDLMKHRPPHQPYTLVEI